MALKGLRKSEQADKQQDIESFISGATKRVKTLEKSQQTYRRLTFSLTEDVDQKIDNLLVECKVARANRSVIVKAAIRHLEQLSEDELQKLILNELRLLNLRKLSNLHNILIFLSLYYGYELEEKLKFGCFYPFKRAKKVKIT